MPYHQITEGERDAMHTLRMQGFTNAAEIARAGGPPPQYDRARVSNATVNRAMATTSHSPRTRTRPPDDHTHGATRGSPPRIGRSSMHVAAPRLESRANCRPMRARSSCCRSVMKRSIGHVWRDKQSRRRALHVHLRRANKPFRKRYAHYDSRGKLGGKRPIASRPSGGCRTPITTGALGRRHGAGR